MVGRQSCVAGHGMLLSAPMRTPRTSAAIRALRGVAAPASLRGRADDSAARLAEGRAGLPYAATMDASDVEPTSRHRPPDNAGERDTLAGVLDFLRATVVNKVAGLTERDAFRESVPPSTLSAAGVVKHLTGVERFWFSIDFADADLPWPWTEQDPHGNFRPDKAETLAGIVADYRSECQRSREVADAAALDDVARSDGMTFKLRYAMVHMIEETARHCGHLDLLRERIDGVTGE